MKRINNKKKQINKKKINRNKQRKMKRKRKMIKNESIIDLDHPIVKKTRNEKDIE